MSDKIKMVVEPTDESILLDFMEYEGGYALAEAGHIFDKGDEPALKKYYVDYYTKRVEDLGFEVVGSDWWLDNNWKSEGYVYTIFIYIKGSASEIRNKIDTKLYNIRIEKLKEIEK